MKLIVKYIFSKRFIF